MAKGKRLMVKNVTKSVDRCLLSKKTKEYAEFHK